MLEVRYRCRQAFSDGRAILFVVILSVVCSFFLTLVVSFLKDRKEEARELERSKQLLLAARIYSPDGYFLLSKDGRRVPAKNIGQGKLDFGTVHDKASDKDVREVYRRRVFERVIDRDGNIMTEAQANTDSQAFLRAWQQSNDRDKGLLPLYKIVDNNGEEIESYVIPVSGLGLWDKIFGYIAVLKDGMTVQGIAWYDQKETPGLGATITEPSWQKQFFGKKIFQPNDQGVIDTHSSPIGITVVKGRVVDVLGKTPKAENAVDGMAGATLTGNGVERAYKNSLEPYRKFFEKISGEG
jgi:Na+-transporting NADH:ubiquinone oxidoreductase subunit C